MSDKLERDIGGLPGWVVDILREWWGRKRTGTVQIHYCQGGVRNLTEQVTRHPPGTQREGTDKE